MIHFLELQIPAELKDITKLLMNGTLDQNITMQLKENASKIVECTILHGYFSESLSASKRNDGASK
jgi:hypothetical protein